MARDLNMIRGREEQMRAQILLNNGLNLREYSDQYGGDVYEEYKLNFYDGANNPAVYTPSVSCSGNTFNKIADLRAILLLLVNAGNRAIDLLLGMNAA
jgi:hypothetical protein